MIIQKLEEGRDYQLLLRYLQLVDSDFGIPLSSKVELGEYTAKLLKNGCVYAILDEDNKEIISCTCFYCNDTDTWTVYWILLSTHSSVRGKGYAKLLINEMIHYCRQKGMHKILCDSVNPIAVSLYKSLGFEEYKVQQCGQLIKTFLKKELK